MGTTERSSLHRIRTFFGSNEGERLGAMLIAALAALMTQSWFLTGSGFVWGDDARFPLTGNLQPYTQQYFHIWTTDIAFGDASVAKIPVLFPHAVALEIYRLLGLPFFPLIYNRTCLFLLMFGIGYSMFYLARQVYGHTERFPAGCFFASLSYMLNIFVLTTILASLGHFALEYAFFPLILALYIRELHKSRSVRMAILTAFAWTMLITPAYSTATVLVTDWVLVLGCCAYHVATTRDGSRIVALRYTALLLIAWVGLNSFWLVPAFLLGPSALEVRYAPYTTGLSFYEQNSVQMVEAFRVVGYWGFTATYKGEMWYPYSTFYALPWAYALGFALPLLACIGLLKSRRKYIPFFGLIAVAGISLMAGPASPFGEVNLRIFGTYPLNILFRDTYQRFAPIVAMSFSLLAGAVFSGGRSE